MANWKPVEVDGASGFEFAMPAPIAERDAGGAAANGKNLFWLTAPARCDRLLDERKPLTPADVEGLRDIVQRGSASAGGATGDGRTDGRVADGLAGACAAVLLLPAQGDPLPAEFRQECKRLLLAICKSPPLPTDYDSAVSQFPTGWDRFAARALPRLWADDPTAHESREALCVVLCAGH